MKLAFNKSGRGLTLLEVLIGTMIFVVLGLVLVMSISELLKRQAITKDQSVASFEVQTTMEEFYALTQTSIWETDPRLEATDNPSPIYVRAKDNGDWEISGSEFPNEKYQVAAYVYKVYRNPNKDGNIDPNCSDPGCYLDENFRRVVANVYPTADNTNILAEATHYLYTRPELLSVIGTGGFPTPDPTKYNPNLSTLSNPDNVDQSANDASHDGTALDVSGTNILLGGDNSNWSGIRIENLDIPPNSTIINAYLLGQSDSDYNADPDFDFIVYGDLNPQSVDFNAADPNCSSRSCTTASSSFAGDEIDSPVWQNQSWYQLADLTEILQEIIDNAGLGWDQLNNAVSFLFNGNGISTRNIFSFDYNGTANSPSFYLAYLTPTPTPTPTPVLINNIVIKSKTGSPDSDIEVYCDPGYQRISCGASHVFSRPEVDIYPVGTNGCHARVGAFNPGTVYAVCTNDLTLPVTTVRSAPIVDYGTGTVSCPAGTQRTGCSIDSANNRPEIDFYPTGVNSCSGTTGVGQAFVYAYCSSELTKPMSIVKTVLNPEYTTVTINCPAGTRRTGCGADSALPRPEIDFYPTGVNSCTSHLGVWGGVVYAICN